MKAAVVAREVAEQEFERMCSAFRVETSLDEMEKITQAQYKYRQNKIVKSIMSGALTVDGEGLPTLKTPNKLLTFQQPTGHTLMVMEGGDGMHAQMALAATELTQTNKGEMSKLHARDFGVVESLTALFLEL